MWEYDVISIDYDAEKLSDGIKRHPHMAQTLSSYGERGWEVVTVLPVAASRAPMFVLRRPTQPGGTPSTSRKRR